MFDVVSWVAGMRRALPTSRHEVEDIRARLDYELGRARRYGGSLSAILVQGVAPSGNASGDWGLFTAELTQSLRLWDMSWIQSDRVLLLLPHTDLSARRRVIERILQAADTMRVETRISASTFPDEAPTGDALLESLLDPPRVA